MRISISCVKMTPKCSREAPWMFATRSQASEFSRIADRVIWAEVPDDSSVYKIWPGGRIEKYQWKGLGRGRRLSQEDHGIAAGA